MAKNLNTFQSEPVGSEPLPQGISFFEEYEAQPVTPDKLLVFTGVDKDFETGLSRSGNKRVMVNGTVETSPLSIYHNIHLVDISSFAAMCTAIYSLKNQPSYITLDYPIVPIGELPLSAIKIVNGKRCMVRRTETMQVRALHLLSFDIDKMIVPLYLMGKPSSELAAYARSLMGEPYTSSEMMYTLSSSYIPDAPRASMKLFFWSSRPTNFNTMREIANAINKNNNFSLFDTSIYKITQPIFVADPVYEDVTQRPNFIRHGILSGQKLSSAIIPLPSNSDNASLLEQIGSPRALKEAGKDDSSVANSPVTAYIFAEANSAVAAGTQDKHYSSVVLPALQGRYNELKDLLESGRGEIDERELERIQKKIKNAEKSFTAALKKAEIGFAVKASVDAPYESPIRLFNGQFYRMAREGYYLRGKTEDSLFEKTIPEFRQSYIGFINRPNIHPAVFSLLEGFRDNDKLFKSAIENDLITQFDRREFDPSVEGEVIYSGVQKYLNLYKGVKDVVSKNNSNNDYSPLQNWLDLSIPEQIVQNYLMDWFAYKVQNPASISPIIPTIIGKQGTGKNSIVETFKGLYKGNVVAATEAHTLAEANFNSNLSTALLVHIDESRTSNNDRKSLEAKIKFLTGNTNVSINEKYKSERTQRRYFNIIITSNDAVPVRMSEHGDERRVVPIRFADGAAQHPITAAFGAWAVSELGHKTMYNYFMQRDVSEFDHNKYPEAIRETDAYKALEKGSKPEYKEILDYWISDMLDGKATAHPYRLQLASKGTGQRGFGYTMAAIEEWLENNGFVKYENSQKGNTINIILPNKSRKSIKGIWYNPAILNPLDAQAIAVKYLDEQSDLDMNAKRF